MEEAQPVAVKKSKEELDLEKALKVSELIIAIVNFIGLVYP